jgi:hypothetical protein
MRGQLWSDSKALYDVNLLTSQVGVKGKQWDHVREILLNCFLQ